MKKAKIILYIFLVSIMLLSVMIPAYAETKKFSITSSDFYDSYELTTQVTWKDFIDNNPQYSDFGYTVDKVFYKGRVINNVTPTDTITSGAVYTVGAECEHDFACDEKLFNSKKVCETFDIQYWCNTCGYTEWRTVNGTGDHEPTVITDIVTPSTCVTPGTAYFRCECGYLFEDETREYLDTSAHSWEYEYGINSNCGYYNRTCEYCSTSYEGYDPDLHSWSEATCLSPKTCTKCAAVVGVALGHSWNEATCTTPKTCSRCSLIEGSELGHQLPALAFLGFRTCTVCNMTVPAEEKDDLGTLIENGVSNIVGGVTDGLNSGLESVNSNLQDLLSLILVLCFVALCIWGIPKIIRSASKRKYKGHSHKRYYNNNSYKRRW